MRSDWYTQVCVFVCTAEGSQARQEGRLQEEAVSALPVPGVLWGVGGAPQDSVPVSLLLPSQMLSFRVNPRKVHVQEKLYLERYLWYSQSRPGDTRGLLNNLLTIVL